MSTITTTPDGTKVFNLSPEDSIFSLSESGNVIIGNQGSTTVSIAGDRNLVQTQSGNDVVMANGGGLTIFTNSGDDNVMFNGTGADVNMGAGNDVFFGRGSGAINSESGDDTISVHGKFSVTAGAGDDTININGGSVFASGGSGNNVFDFQSATDDVNAEFNGSGSDVMKLSGEESNWHFLSDPFYTYAYSAGLGHDFKLKFANVDKVIFGDGNRASSVSDILAGSTGENRDVLNDWVSVQ